MHYNDLLDEKEYSKLTVIINTIFDDVKSVANRI